MTFPHSALNYNIEFISSPYYRTIWAVVVPYKAVLERFPFSEGVLTGIL